MSDQYKGPFSSTANANRLLSPNLWADFPIAPVRNGTVDGHFHFDDFHSLSALTLGAEGGPYYAFGDTGGTITKVADSDHGKIVLTTDGTDEDGLGLAYGNAAGIARSSAIDRWCLEASYSPGQVGDTLCSSFLGLYETTVVPTGDATIVDSTGVLDASEDFIGWRTILGNGDYWEPIYQEGGATLKAVDANGNANATGSGYAGAVAAGTYVKWGMKWDGTRLGYYKNGLEVAHIIPTSSLSFPDVNHMMMILVGKAHTGAAATWNLDFWAIGALCEG
jgi:hypothetical protein